MRTAGTTTGELPLLGVTRALWRHRSLVASLVRRELQLHSVRAVWGRAWLVIQPAVQIVLYTIVFAEVLRTRLPGVEDRLGYGLFLCAGLIHWNYFAELITRCQRLFLDHVDLVKVLRVPRSTLPMAVLLTASVNYAIVASIFLLVLALLGRWPGWALLATLPLVGVQLLLALGIGVLTGTVNVFFRDVGHAMSVVLQFWFWLTPIVYPITIVPEPFQSWMAWNPLVPLVLDYQQIVLSGTLPDFAGLLPSLALALGLALVAWVVFRKLSADVVDEL